VVDDDATVQEVLTLFLKGAYDVSHATTGADALMKLHRDPVDLVLLDHRLPDRTGLNILPELRSIRPSLPVIMMTGYGSEWICATAFKLGVADYLQKPVSAVELVGAVRRILRPSDPAYENAMLMGSQVAPCIPVQRAMALIQECYWDHLSLSTLARHVGMSKYRLSRRFHEVLGITFRDYLQRVRLERAKSLLANGDTSITEVAQMVGFGDLPRFDKLFKRYTGLPPSVYRSLTPACVDKYEDSQH
jgi:YesN/AraC family two-component response regulator